MANDEIKAEISKEVAQAMKQYGGQPALDIHYDWEEEKMKLENDLFAAESKIQSLEKQLRENAESHAKEMTELMLELNQKRAEA